MVLVVVVPSVVVALVVWVDQTMRLVAHSSRIEKQVVAALVLHLIRRHPAIGVATSLGRHRRYYARAPEVNFQPVSPGVAEAVQKDCVVAGW